MFKAIINQWYITQSGPYHVVQGFTGVEVHMNKAIRTSYVELFNFKEGWIKTRNSFYKLGTQLGAEETLWQNPELL